MNATCRARHARILWVERSSLFLCIGSVWFGVPPSGGSSKLGVVTLAACPRRVLNTFPWDAGSGWARRLLPHGLKRKKKTAKVTGQLRGGGVGKERPPCRSNPRGTPQRAFPTTGVVGDPHKTDRLPAKATGGAGSAPSRGLGALVVAVHCPFRGSHPPRQGWAWNLASPMRGGSNAGGADRVIAGAAYGRLVKGYNRIAELANSAISFLLCRPPNVEQLGCCILTGRQERMRRPRTRRGVVCATFVRGQNEIAELANSAIRFSRVARPMASTLRVA